MSNKIRSFVTYFHEFPDLSTIRTQVIDEYGNTIHWHLKGAKDRNDNEQLTVIVRKDVVESMLDTPIGCIPSMKPVDNKQFQMTFKEYKEFIIRFWENGPSYYDTLQDTK